MIASLSVALLSLASLLLAWIDLRRGLIPDWLNLAIAFVGLARIAALDGSAAALLGLCEGIIVFTTIWLLRRLYHMVRKFEGLGLGDVKLLGASGIWIGIAGVPMQLFVASVTALAAAGALRLAGHAMTRQTPLPFGPFIALGLLTTLALEEAGWIG
jgi:leader peptidase (prepilin peptidase) / N-methyltransferase